MKLPTVRRWITADFQDRDSLRDSLCYVHTIKRERLRATLIDNTACEHYEDDARHRVLNSTAWMIERHETARDKTRLGQADFTRSRTCIVVLLFLLFRLPLEQYPAFLEGPAWDQARSHISIAFPSGLPPAFKRV